MAGGILLGAALLMTACSGGDAPAPEGSTAAQTPAPHSPAAEPTSSATTDSTPSASTPSTDAPTTYPAVSSPTWQIPSEVPGWEASIVGENGVDQLSDQDGCQYTATLNLIDSMPGLTDDQVTEEQTQGYLWSFDPSQDPQHEQSQTSVRTGTPEGAVEMVRVDTTHTDPAGEQYRSAMMLRVLGENSTQLSLHYTCPATTFDEAELDHLLSQTTLLGVEPSDL